MKNFKVKTLLTLFFIAAFVSPLISQGNFYNFKNAGVNFWYPDNWLVREHILLIMIPKEEDLTVNLQLMESVNLNNAVNESLNELKILYPEDTVFIVKDVEINKISAKEIKKTAGGITVNYIFLNTPEGKILKLYYTASDEKVLKYNSDLEKIKKSFKPVN